MGEFLGDRVDCLLLVRIEFSDRHIELFFLVLDMKSLKNFARNLSKFYIFGVERTESSIDDILFGGKVSLLGFLGYLIVDFLGELSFFVTVSD